MYGPDKPFLFIEQFEPCNDSMSGICQDAVILVEEIADKINSLGAFEGTEIKTE